MISRVLQIDSASVKAKNDESTEQGSSEVDDEDYGVFLRSLDVQRRSLDPKSVHPRAVMIDTKSNIGARPFVKQTREDVPGDRDFSTTWCGASSVHESDPGKRRVPRIYSWSVFIIRPYSAYFGNLNFCLISNVQSTWGGKFKMAQKAVL